MNKGDIVLVPFPFTNLSQTKLRPAVILWADPTGNDVTLCFISSQSVESLYEGEFRLDPSDEEFKGTGLKAASKVRVTRIVTIERSLISRRLGRLGNRQIQQMNSAII
ncbi:type II toxin-antitoxin system PemK/MazF family toxin [Merismopedia glauca]|uniref:PemK family protein n=1 Tax=Merismopedia glauca CCAP 1448/3 TaxID=1296344 RepID=A0A2T1C6C6_9CYAN|nr:type II toxin-antitoxin system PemK/MazF family toxin [Merismopedia glauca]PSB03693.1 PemK family protein [Merismopedia glauca CCAP 1448/3]